MPRGEVSARHHPIAWWARLTSGNSRFSEASIHHRGQQDEDDGPLAMPLIETAFRPSQYGQRTRCSAHHQAPVFERIATTKTRPDRAFHAAPSNTQVHVV